MLFSGLMAPTAIRRRNTRVSRSGAGSPGASPLLVAIVGALGALIGSAGPTVVAWKATTSTDVTSQRTLEITERGQAADRFTAAVEQIGSDDLSVRLGGVYALNRIANDNTAYYYQVQSVLAALIRTGTVVDEKSPADVVAALQFVLPDIRYRANPADLSGARISHVELRDRYANEVNLRGAMLSDVSFRGSSLVGARLDGALLRGDLEGANLTNAFLCGADLSAAAIVPPNAERQETNLHGAVVDDKTRLPPGASMDQLGVIHGTCNA